jgi:hypothetical protein
LLAHASEKVHDSLRTSRAALVAAIAFVSVLEFSALLQHTLTLLLLVVVVATHALWVWGVVVVLLRVLEFSVVGGVARGTALHGWMRVPGVGELLISNGTSGGVVKLCLVWWSRRRSWHGVCVAYPAGAIMLAVVKAGPHAACA